MLIDRVQMMKESKNESTISSSSLNIDCRNLSNRQQLWRGVFVGGGLVLCGLLLQQHCIQLARAFQNVTFFVASVVLQSLCLKQRVSLHS
jgi:hypothetical protein